MTYKTVGFLILIVISFLSCDSSNKNNSYDYGTQNDSARYYFQKGWEEILDNGRWTESEIAFRKAIEFDPDWLLGKSMVGRITRNLAERQKLLSDLEASKHLATLDERSLLDVNMLSMKAANNRGMGIPNTKESTRARMLLAEKNFGAFARKYPQDDYLKAEYIEFLHANHGAQVALDSLKLLATANQLTKGFYLSYAADLELELGHMDRAMAYAMILNENLTDPSFLSPKMVQANIYISMDSLQKASDLVDQVVAADSNHMIALGMQSRLKEALKNQ
ncbi:hypothetical protein [Roseivirga misakiensis]|uniref:Tetratricopeptide repeat protein n=1 Tax=Roseivirga misakiensis TaxID=1563681 RepID=A0A1E5SXZ3_9BACT|nr:hypothetical protein [Roseivirga misakiensis]OEK03980.1 hypothetical protein BFP71_10805 [Roseivirga misakiensis]